MSFKRSNYTECIRRVTSCGFQQLPPLQLNDRENNAVALNAISVCTTRVQTIARTSCYLRSYGYCWASQHHLLQGRLPFLWGNDLCESICTLFCWWAIKCFHFIFLQHFAQRSHIYFVNSTKMPQTSWVLIFQDLKNSIIVLVEFYLDWFLHEVFKEYLQIQDFSEHPCSHRDDFGLCRWTSYTGLFLGLPEHRKTSFTCCYLNP